MCDCVNDSLIEKRQKKKRQRQAIDNKFFFYSLTDTELYTTLRCINKEY